MPWISVSRRCNNACVFCDVAADLDGADVPAADIKARLDAARGAGARSVVLTGGEPLLAGQVVRALAYARGIGLRTVLATNGRLLADPQILGRLEAVGVGRVIVALHGDEAVHTALTGGDPLAWTQTMAALAGLKGRFRLSLRTVLCAPNAHLLGTLVDLARAHDATWILHRLRPASKEAAVGPLGVAGGDDLALPPRRAHDLLVDAAARALAAGVAFAWEGFDGDGIGADLPEPGGTPDPVALTQLTRRLPMPVTAAGFDLPDAHQPALAEALGVPPDALGHVLALRGTPLITLPADRGGRALPPPAPPAPPATEPSSPPRWAAPADGPVHVVIDDPDNPLLAAATLPALAAALRQRVGASAEVVVHTPWEAPPGLDPGRPGVFGGLRRALGDARPWHPLEPRLKPGALEAARAGWAAELDMSGAAVIVATTGAARWLLGRRPAGARFHLLETAPLAAAGLDLGPDDVVRTPFFDRAHALAAGGVDLGAVLARPWPWPDDLTATPDPDGPVVALGGARLDPALASAARDAGYALVADAPFPGATPWPDGSAARLALLRRARAVWLPLTRAWSPPLPVSAAGWTSLALALGLPIVAVETPVTALWLHHGAAGTLVPPDRSPRPDGRASDMALHAHTVALAHATAHDGVRAARVGAWARELIDGAAPSRLVPTPADPQAGRAEAGPPWRLW